MSNNLGTLNEGALITYAIDEIIKVFSGMYTLTDMTQPYDPGITFQRSGNQYWKPVQQQAVTFDGFDLSETDGAPSGVLELSIQGSLADPTSTFRQLRVDDLRDESSYRRAVRADAMRLKGEMEFRGLEKARTHGSFIIVDPDSFSSTDNLLWDALSNADTRSIETEFNKDAGSCIFLNPASYRAGGRDLVTSTARFRNNIPDEAYERGYITPQVAGIGEVYQHSKLSTQPAAAGGANTSGTASVNEFAPIAFETSSNGSNVPFDNRFAVLTITSNTDMVIGDKFEIPGVFAVTLDEKESLDYLQTFTIVDVDTVNSQLITISPRPIALDDISLTPLQQKYANINTTIPADSTLTFLNIVTRKSNVYMVKDAMVLASSPIPLNHELFQNLHAEQFQVGPINGVIGFDGNLATLAGSYRIALWYEWNIEKPEQIGILLDAQT